MPEIRAVSRFLWHRPRVRWPDIFYFIARFHVHTQTAHTHPGRWKHAHQRSRSPRVCVQFRKNTTLRSFVLWMLSWNLLQLIIVVYRVKGFYVAQVGQLSDMRYGVCATLPRRGRIFEHARRQVVSQSACHNISRLTKRVLRPCLPKYFSSTTGRTADREFIIDAAPRASATFKNSHHPTFGQIRNRSGIASPLRSVTRNRLGN